MNVLENVIEAPFHVKKMDKAQAKQKAQSLLEKVGLKDKALSYPKNLSGGQKQRVVPQAVNMIETKNRETNSPASQLFFIVTHTC
jgi:polar amino acid transport system ATP-binding protein